jgi:hypothetical protein
MKFRIAIVLLVVLLSACAATTPVAPVDSPLLASPLPSPSPLPFVGPVNPAACRVTLPLVARKITPGPGPTPVAIYDCSGAPAPAGWLVDTFGFVTLTHNPGGARLSELRCSIGPAVLVIHVERSDGEPAANQPVVFYWPDAPTLPEELWNCGLTQGVYGSTNQAGDVGFGLGPGSYYWPQDVGPHTIWIGGSGDCLAGLGMLGGTNHQHLDSGWTVPDVQATIDAKADWGFTPGALVYPEEVDGRMMPVVVWPALEPER